MTPINYIKIDPNASVMGDLSPEELEAAIAEAFSFDMDAPELPPTMDELHYIAIHEGEYRQAVQSLESNEDVLAIMSDYGVSGDHVTHDYHHLTRHSTGWAGFETLYIDIPEQREVVLRLV